MKEKIAVLKRMLDESNYTAALCGAGMLTDGGVRGIKNPDRAYAIERAYGASPEYIFTSAYYNTRPEQFFHFYKEEVLRYIPDPGLGSYAMARMEQAGKLQCVITANVFNQAIRGGCEHVINLHGTVYENQCPRCGELYTVEDILEMKGIPCCRVCNATIRPKVSLFGEMVDSRIMTRTTEEIEKAEVLLLVGTTLRSETFSNYLKYFHGKYLAVLHRTPHYSDEKADLTLIGEPGQILSQLGY